jgi:hypothetical protein
MVRIREVREDRIGIGVVLMEVGEGVEVGGTDCRTVASEMVSRIDRDAALIVKK